MRRQVLGRNAKVFWAGLCGSAVVAGTLAITSQSAPVVAIAPSGTNQFVITVTNGPGSANYQVYRATQLTAPGSSWTLQEIGKVGQTQFAVHGDNGAAGYFRVNADGCVPAPTSPLLVNVRDAAYGAKGDGVSDDTAAIQKALNQVAGTGGTVLVPTGTYMINAIASSSRGLLITSNMTLSLASDATLKALPNASANYALIQVESASDVNIIGGIIEGERSAHTGIGGEWGMGIQINHSQRVVIQGVCAKECWGDGFYLTGASQDVTLCNVTADHNRRQGMSIVWASGIVVKNSTFKNTVGTLPEAGIDIEPNPQENVSNVSITGCLFTNNAGDGIATGAPLSFTNAYVTNVIIDGNSVIGNGVNPTNGSRGIEVSNGTGHRIINNIVKDNYGIGLYIRNGASNNLVSSNWVTGTVAHTAGEPGYGIILYLTAGNTVTGNTILSNAYCGLRDAYPTGTNVITPNTLIGNGPCP